METIDYSLHVASLLSVAGQWRNKGQRAAVVPPGAAGEGRKTVSLKIFVNNDPKSEYGSLLNQPKVSYCNKLVFGCHLA